MRFSLRLPFVSNDSPRPSVAERFLSGMNAERAKVGLPPYWWSEALGRAAQIRADDMVARGYFGHRTPDGRSGYVDALAAVGIHNWVLAGENLALNNFSMTEAVERAMASLMKSPTHRENILEPTFDSVGVGYAKNPDATHVFVNLFIGGATT